MKSHACYNYSSLLTSWKFWYIQQHPEFHFQNSKRPFYDISNPGMCVIKHLFYACWWRAVLPMLHMVPCTPIRRKITRTVWVPHINYIILPYILKFIMSDIWPLENENLLRGHRQYITWRWMWKFVIKCGHCIVEYSHIMNRTRPSRKHKCKSNVKITNSKHILWSVVVSVQMVHYLPFCNHHLYMCTIYCTYIVIEVW